ncbi:cobalamin biosynthesis protein [Streptomyces sp. AJS327]|nr:cobalamin biosynthesis protein [Streptomyces sp. AJS327]
MLGLGLARGAGETEVRELAARMLRAAGDPAGRRLAALATVEERALEPVLLAVAERFGVPLRGYPAGALARVPVPHPSPVPSRALGTASVAEAAALLAAGAGSRIVVGKRRSAPPGGPARATAAVARGAPAPGGTPRNR